MPFPSPSGPNSYIWNLKQVYVARQGNNWPTAGARALFAGGTTPSVSNVIDYINIASTGNATDFGDLTQARQTLRGGGVSSSTRALFTAGYLPGSGGVNTIDYVTISTTGNAADFGDALNNYYNGANCSNATRGLYTGMVGAWTNAVDYATIATLGNSSDFGDMANAYQVRGNVASTTRALFAGGYSDPGGGPDIRPAVNSIEFFTIATTGNGTNFGDLTVARKSSGGMSSGTRGAFGGGYNNDGAVTYNVIDYVTIASAGNATDFGDMLTANNNNSGTSDKSRGVLGGGASPSITNVIQYITIATTGNAVDFGDLTSARNAIGCTSNNHGGL